MLARSMSRTAIKASGGLDFVVGESLWEDTGPGTPFGIPGHGRRLTFRLLHIFHMTRDGQIKHGNVWLDFASILQQVNAPSRRMRRAMNHNLRSRGWFRVAAVYFAVGVTLGVAMLTA